MTLSYYIASLFWLSAVILVLAAPDSWFGPPAKEFRMWLTGVLGLFVFSGVLNLVFGYLP